MGPPAKFRSPCFRPNVGVQFRLVADNADTFTSWQTTRPGAAPRPALKAQPRVTATAPVPIAARQAVPTGSRCNPEPIPAASPIRDLPNVFMSPHIAGVTAACRPRFFSFMVDELERFFGGRDTLFDITPSTLANRRGLVTPGV